MVEGSASCWYNTCPHDSYNLLLKVKVSLDRMTTSIGKIAKGFLVRPLWLSRLSYSALEKPHIQRTLSLLARDAPINVTQRMLHLVHGSLRLFEHRCSQL